MLCKNCNAMLPENADFCTVCGAKIERPEQEEVIEQAQPLTFYEDTNSQKKEITVEDLPEHLKPMGAWSYFWLQVLYSVPIVGFIFLMIFTFNGGNINRRSFTRSYWCAALVIGILITVVILLSFILVGGIRTGVAIR